MVSHVPSLTSLESLQLYFTRRICERCSIPYQSYADRLYKLGIRTLEYRRLLADIIMVYKMIHGFVDLRFEKFFDLYTSPYSTRRHKYTLEVKQCYSKGQKGWFSLRVVKTWNSLPASLVELTSLDDFSKTLKKLDLNNYADFIIKVN